MSNIYSVTSHVAGIQAAENTQADSAQQSESVGEFRGITVILAPSTPPTGNKSLLAYARDNANNGKELKERVVTQTE